MLPEYIYYLLIEYHCVSVTTSRACFSVLFNLPEQAEWYMVICREKLRYSHACMYAYVCIIQMYIHIDTFYMTVYCVCVCVAYVNMYVRVFVQHMWVASVSPCR